MKKKCTGKEVIKFKDKKVLSPNENKWVLNKYI